MAHPDIADATEIFVLPGNENVNGDTITWLVVTRHPGEERIYATCPYRDYAHDVVRGLLAIAPGAVGRDDPL